MTLTTPPRTLTRRGTDRSGNETFAAAARVDLRNPNDARYAQQTVRSAKIRAKAAWKWYSRIGEVHYALSRAARIAGYGRLFAEHLEADGKWVRVDSGPADDIVQGIYSPYGGLRGFIGTYFTLMKVTGDALLVRIKDDQGYDGYHFVAPDAVDANSLERLGTSDPVKEVTLDWVTSRFGASTNNQMVRKVAPEDLLGRVWNPGIQFVDDPDSALMALEPECEVLWASTQNIKSKLVSRFAAAGILFLPNKLATIQVAGKDGTKFAEDGLKYIIEAMTENMDHWDDAEALFPILISGDGEIGDQIKHITIDREIFEQDIHTRRELIDRIYAGLDIQSQATRGIGQATHWSAWAVSDEELRLVAKPDLQNMCWALTRLILQDRLMKPESQGGMDMPSDIAATWRIGFEMNEASSKTSLQEDARQLNDRGWLQGDELASVSGFETDAKMDEEEYVRWMGRVTHNPALMAHVGKIADIDWDRAVLFAGKKGPAGAVGSEPSSAPGVGDPGSPNPSDQERD